MTPEKLDEILERQVDIMKFVEESNRIEGIFDTTPAHIQAHNKFLDQPVTVQSIVELVSVLQPDAKLRNMYHIPGVRVGSHIAPPSGPEIERDLIGILKMEDPWAQHVAYENLHPFTDGNGRSGRAIWLHHHIKHPHVIRRGFLHSFYYQTLERTRVV